ncbi:MAG: 4-hydroxybenzoyl-CoA reductase subunit beta [Oligoflexia bacterium]|nr:4-hydroxybenzoyl-CoA reductase subunit beta [Oligoflexia bacterium]
MRGFSVVQADSPEHAVALYGSSPDPVYLAGGTDLLPTLKLDLRQPRTVIAVGRALSQDRVDQAGWIKLGAGMSLARVAALDLSPLAQAASRVAAPQIRNAGTLGGNVMLDTRCRYYNQSRAWRNALGGCLRAQGDLCCVTGSTRSCVATQCSDSVPALLVLGAHLRLLGPDGPRQVPLVDLLQYDGMHQVDLKPGELLTHVLVPKPHPDAIAAADKLTVRGAIDFPMLSVAVLARFDGDLLADLRIAIGAVSPKPRLLPGLNSYLGQRLDDPQLDAIAQGAWKRTRPQGSIAGDLDWRRQMTRVMVRRLLVGLKGAGGVG